ALGRAESDQQNQAAAQLQIAALDLESILKKYEALPFAQGFQSDVRQVLQHPEAALSVDRLNRAFKTIQQQSRAVNIFMLNRQGV
ncbi:hypothetical protein ABTK28_21465, partial [Acinetobacter baumannii]